MGLDMYLTREIYIGNSPGEDENIFGLKIDIEVALNKEKIPLGAIKYVTDEVMYWRKANAIHRWFVENVQEGKDDCQRYEIETKKLVEFFDLLVKAHLTKDPTIFEPQEGFFFGSSDIDDWYWENILNTIEVLKPHVDMIKSEEKQDKDTIGVTTYYYQASW